MIFTKIIQPYFQRDEKQKQQEELAMMGGNLLGLAVGAVTSRRPPAQEGYGQQY